jgi:hypothetical protein
MHITTHAVLCTPLDENNFECLKSQKLTCKTCGNMDYNWLEPIAAHKIKMFALPVPSQISEIEEPCRATPSKSLLPFSCLHFLRLLRGNSGKLVSYCSVCR